MAKDFIRFYEHVDVDDIKAHLLIYGALAGMCAKCREMSIKLEAHQCPGCATEFKYVSFQNVRENKPKMVKLSAERPSMKFVDYDDFKRIDGESQARKLLG